MQSSGAAVQSALETAGAERMEVDFTWIAMLLSMALVGLFARVVSIPYPILLVAAGVVVGLIPGLKPPQLSPELVLYFFLPVLVYKEAFHTSWRDLHRWLRPILFLAVGLVIATIVAVAGAARLIMPEMPWTVAFVLGAIVSPTDTVAANTVLHKLHVPRRLSAILGGESLLNDATGLVALQLAMGVVISETLNWFDVGLAFVWTVVSGAGIGLLIGVLMHQAHRRIRDTAILFTLSLIAPLAAFALAAWLNASGVLAVLAVGFWVSWRFHAVQAHTRYDLYAVWRLMAFVVDAVCFLLIGIEIPRVLASVTSAMLPHYLIAGGIVTLTVIAVRLAWMFPATYVPLKVVAAFREREGGLPPRRGVFLASWCGMRGAISLAAALSVQEVIAKQQVGAWDAVIICTFCVIIGTLILQGLTLHPMIRLLGISGDANAEEEERLTRISMMQAALSRLDQLKAETRVDPVAIDHVEATYMERLRLLISAPAPVRRCSELTDKTDSLFAVEYEALQSERARLLSLRDAADINDLTHLRLQEELDMIEMRALAHTKPQASH